MGFGDKGTDGSGIQEGVTVVLWRMQSVGRGGLFDHLGMMGDDESR